METVVKERPILFSTPMVKAILSGQKTQTRRVVKQIDRLAADVQNTNLLRLGDISGFCPFGQVGVVLWVRENFTVLEPEHCMGGMDSRFVYKADNCEASEEVRKQYIKIGYPYGWKPSIYMPREACRLRLEITNIRVERLQDISEPDAVAEGATSALDLKWERGNDEPRGIFGQLWESINGHDSWEKNPWVWVIEFKKL